MKSTISCLLFFYFAIYNNSVNAENISAKYNVSTNGITIGVLFWELSKNDLKYSLSIKLKNKGFLSPLLRFEGKYAVYGGVLNDIFVPQYYSQHWATNKKKRVVEIDFKNDNIVSLKQKPDEKEFPRIDTRDLNGYVDPLSSFLNLMNGKDESKTIDGRRVYNLVLSSAFIEENKKTYVVKKYTNIWADHKKNNLKEIAIIKKRNSLLPEAIYINFNERIFSILVD
tara:strand:+ start:344 stop:1021 length:678 start_codon:yes stop_codon:yes gene_type:complete